MAAPDHAAAAPFSALARYFQISLYLLLLVSVLTLVSTGKLDLVSTLVPPAALLVKGFRWWRGLPPELSTRAANWLVVGYIFFFPADLWWVSRMASADAQNPALFAALLAAIHLLLFAMLVRLFSARAMRDYLFLALLACAAMLAAAILTVDTVFLGFFLVFLALCVSTFIGLDIQRSAAGATVAPVASGTPAARQLHRALSVTSGAVAVSALVLGTAIFFLLPRFRAGYLSGFRLQPTLISGFSDDVELGQIGQIKQSNAVVMRVRIEGDPGPARGLHWRGVALTTFDGRRWFTESPQPRALSEDEESWIRLDTAPPEPRRRTVPLRYTVFLEPLASDALFVAAEPVRLRGQLTSAIGPRRAGSLRRSFVMVDRTGSLSNPFHNFGNIRYEAVSQVPRIAPEDLRAASVDYPPELREDYLQLPALDPRIPALAREITARSTTAFDRARAIELYLQSRYGYTLDLSGPPPADPLAHFLFERRAGHCEYFAAAMTVMLRTLGIPARYVNGFLTGEYNDLGGDFIVRARDAHSWVEAYFPGYGWVTFDPTPAAADREITLLGRLAHYWDWFELQWSEWVINYDFVRQYTLAQGVGRASREWSERLRRRFREAREAATAQLRDWQAAAAGAPPWVPLLAGVAAAAALGLSRRAVRERLRERLLLARMRAGAGSLSAAEALLPYRRMLRLLERRGWRKSPAQTPLEFAASLAAEELAAPVAELTELYQAARFGGRAADAARYAALLTRIESTLRARPAPSR